MMQGVATRRQYLRLWHLGSDWRRLCMRRVMRHVRRQLCMGGVLAGGVHMKQVRWQVLLPSGCER